MFWFVFFITCLCAGVVSLILCYLLMNTCESLADIVFDVLARIGIFGILIGVSGTLMVAPIALGQFNQRSWNNKIVDGIVETPSEYVIYFDDNTSATINKNENITIVKDTDTMKVNTIKMFTYSFEIPGDCIIWKWQPYSKIGGARD